MPTKTTVLEFLKEQSRTDKTISNQAPQLKNEQHQKLSQLRGQFKMAEYRLFQDRQFIGRELRHLDNRQDRQMKWILFLLVMQVIGFILIGIVFNCF